MEMLTDRERQFLFERFHSPPRMKASYLQSCLRKPSRKSYHSKWKRLWKLRLCRHWFWSGNGRDTKPSHLSSWSKVCKPLCEGRLRIRDLQVQIKAFQAKQLWRVLNERTSSYMGPTGECIIWCRTGGYPDVDVHKCFLCRKSIASTNFFVHQHKKWRIRDLHRLS